MVDYPAKGVFRGRGPWEREAVRNGFPPEHKIGDRVSVTHGNLRARVNNVELRQVDPPVWRFQVAGAWYFATELEACK